MASQPKPVLVCGMGRLGQHCCAVLKDLGIPVYGLDRHPRESWDTKGLPYLLDHFTSGDCRHDSVLQDAGILSCRAIVLATSDERVNVGAALAARKLHPEIRIVIRSSQDNLNSLLEERLGNLVPLDTAHLPSTAFSLAAIGDETVGLFSVEGRHLRVVERPVAVEGWAHGREIYELNTRWRSVLHRTPAANRHPVEFYGWHPNDTIQPGDLLSYVEFYQADPVTVPALNSLAPAAPSQPVRAKIRGAASRLWTAVTDTYRFPAAVACYILLLHFAGQAIYRLVFPGLGPLDAFNVATVLLVDGYGALFGQLKLQSPVPPAALLLFSLLMSMSGAVTMGMLYATLTGRVLSSQLQFRRREGKIPKAEHVVVVGLGPLGQRVAELLRELQRPVVGVTAERLDPGLLPKIPVVTGDLRESLKKANCATAASVVATTGDDVANLELALMSARVNPRCRVVIRTDDAQFGRNVAALSPLTTALSVYAVSARAFAAAALGEKVLRLIRIGQETILAVEFTVESGDTLEGRLLSEVIFGYGLVAVFHQRGPSGEKEFFPDSDVRLEPGHRLVVLATIAALQRVEHGVTAPRDHKVRVIRALNADAAFNGARTISRVVGCTLETAHALMENLPATLEQPLFLHQAARLVRELFAVGVNGEVLPAPANS